MLIKILIITLSLVSSLACFSMDQNGKDLDQAGRGLDLFLTTGADNSDTEDNLGLENRLSIGSATIGADDSSRRATNTTSADANEVSASQSTESSSEEISDSEFEENNSKPKEKSEEDGDVKRQARRSILSSLASKGRALVAPLIKGARSIGDKKNEKIAQNIIQIISKERKAFLVLWGTINSALAEARMNERDRKRAGQESDAIKKILNKCTKDELSILGNAVKSFEHAVSSATAEQIVNSSEAMEKTYRDSIDTLSSDCKQAFLALSMLR